MLAENQKRLCRKQEPRRRSATDTTQQRRRGKHRRGKHRGGTLSVKKLTRTHIRLFFFYSGVHLRQELLSHGSKTKK